MPEPRRETTQLLADMVAGDRAAAEAFVQRIYAELMSIADLQMRRQPADHTLQPAALVHEAYLKLFDGKPLELLNRRHFVAVATKAMQQILVDHARTKARSKRAGPRHRVPLDSVLAAYDARHIDVLAMNEALDELTRQDPQLAVIAQLRVFGGLTVRESADQLGLPLRSVERSWALAKAWLHGKLGSFDDART